MARIALAPGVRPLYFVVQEIAGMQVSASRDTGTAPGTAGPGGSVAAPRHSPARTGPPKPPSEAFSILVLVGSIACAEALAMLVLPTVEGASYLAISLLDVLLMILVAFPLAWILAFRPLHRQIVERDRAERELGELASSLEERVARRTVQLREVNERLEAERERSEESAREAHRRADELAVVLDAMAEPLLQLDADGFVRRANRAALAALELDPVGLHRDVVGERIDFRATDGSPAAPLAFLPSDPGPGSDVVTRRFLMGGAVSGRERMLDVSLARLAGAGEPAGVISVWHDVTERERLLSQIVAERSRLKTVVDSITDAYVSYDRQWRFLGLNRVAEELVFRRLAGELVGKVVWELYPHVADGPFGTLARQASAEGKPVHFEIPSRIVDGRWFEAHVYPREEGIDVYLRDITERKRTEARLVFLASFPELNPNPVVEVDLLARRVRYANPAARGVLPDLPENGLEHPWLSGVDAIAAELLATGGSATTREVPVGASWFSQTLNLVPQGGPLRIYGTDVTRRVEAIAELTCRAAELRRSEAVLRGILDATHESIWLFGPDGSILLANDIALRRLGWTRGEVFDRKLSDGLPPALAESRFARIRQVFDTARPVEFEDDHAGMVFTHSMYPVLDPAGQVLSVVSFNRNVTGRRRMEEALRELNADLDRKVKERTSQLLELNTSLLALSRSLEVDTVLEALLEHLRPLVPFDRAEAFLLEHDGRLAVRAASRDGRVARLPAGERPAFEPLEVPLLRSVFHGAGAVVIPDLAAHPEWTDEAGEPREGSWLGMPLAGRDGALGLFSLLRREPDSYTPEDVRLAEALFAQASVAVQNAIYFEQIQEAHERLRALSRRLVEVQEKERRAVARELHDDAGQVLASLRLGLRALERAAPGNQAVEAQVAELRRTTDEVLESLHRLASDLRPACLDQLGLEAALGQHIQSVGRKAGLQIGFRSLGLGGRRLPVDLETALYRTVQEALTNVLLHAGASQVSVLVERRDGRLIVVVEDDGCGFDPERVRGTQRLGLVGMRERAETLGGSLTLETAPGSGTTIVVDVPCVEPAPEGAMA